MRIEQLETPVPVVNLPTVDRNIMRMQAYCDTHHLNLRPHIKTHKLPWLAHRQLQAGAVGITAQKLSEAEVMAQAGVNDILVTYNIIGDAKAERLARLARQCSVQVTADNEHAVHYTAQAARLAETRLPVLVEIDSGGDRTGLRDPGAALQLARQIQAHPELSFAGLMTYPLSESTAEQVAAIRRLFAQHGIEVPTVSVGGTPSAHTAHAIEGVTELRVGTYVYNDRMMVHAGAATYDDCALHVHATVVSTPAADRAILDAGSKSLSSDLVRDAPGYGHIIEYPAAVIHKVNEEHAIVDVSACLRAPRVGERVRIIPNHVCVVTNLHDEIIMHRDGVVSGRHRVHARGATL